MTKIMIIIALQLTLSACINRSPEQSHEDLTAQQQQDKMIRCAKLQKQIKDLEGKPLRRSSAREYYANECLDSDKELY